MLNSGKKFIFILTQQSYPLPLHVAADSSSPLAQSTIPSHIQLAGMQSLGLLGFPQKTSYTDPKLGQLDCNPKINFKCLRLST